MGAKKRSIYNSRAPLLLYYLPKNGKGCVKGWDKRGWTPGPEWSEGYVFYDFAYSADVLNLYTRGWNSPKTSILHITFLYFRDPLLDWYYPISLSARRVFDTYRWFFVPTTTTWISGIARYAVFWRNQRATAGGQGKRVQRFLCRDPDAGITRRGLVGCLERYDNALLRISYLLVTGFHF